MTGSLVALISAVPMIILLGVNVFQSILWTRREQSWNQERARLLDTIVAHNAAEFRVRQTTQPRIWADADEQPRHASPNPRRPRPTPIGLDGGNS